MLLSQTFQPPYYAVMFSAVRSADNSGYGEMVRLLREAVEGQPGYLGMEGIARDGCEITVSYWRTVEDIQRWRLHEQHRLAQQLGKSKWYRGYQVRIARVEREYGFGDMVPSVETD